MTILRRFARGLAFSPLLAPTRRLWELNQQDWNLPLSKFQKLSVGIHLILRDYADGLFPPSFPDRGKAYDAEIRFKFAQPGYAPERVTDDGMRKPFLYGPALTKAWSNFLGLIQAFRRLGIKPPQRLLELGCGYGWMAEALAAMRFDVTGTSISPHEIGDAQYRVKSLEAKHLAVKLEYRTSPMETVDQAVAERIPFDAVFVVAALHHAFDWRQAVQAAYNCLKEGGWLVIANEPNALHVFLSYRLAKLGGRHEVGFTRTELVRRLRRTGFRKVVCLRNRASFYVRHHWLAARK